MAKVKADVEPWPFDSGFSFVKSASYDDRAREKIRAAFVADGAQSVVEEKCDGWRVLIARAPLNLQDGGVVHVYSRGVSVVTRTRRDLVDEHGSISCVDDVSETIGYGDAVEAELIWPGHRAAEVPTALKDARLRKELAMRAFGRPFDESRLVPTLRRQRELLESDGLPRPKLLSYGAHIYDPTQLCGWAREQGVEGWMIKMLDVEIGDPAWAHLWWKLKREATVDVVVLGDKDAEFGIGGKFYGQIGALIVGVVCWDHDSVGTHDCWELDLEDGHGPTRFREIACVSGMDDADRAAMTAEREKLCGRVCEVECQATGGKLDGRLRHPRFVRWREDKPARECRGEEIYGPRDGEQMPRKAAM